MLLFSHPITSNSLRPHELQHTRPPCPSPSSEVYPSSCPLHRWCHPAILSSDTLFSFCFQSFPASGTFPVNQLFVSGDQNTGASASALIHEYSGFFFPSDWLVWPPCCPRDSQESSPVQRHQFFGTLPSLWLSKLLCDPWKDHSLDYTDLCHSIMSLLFNTLSKCVILPGKKQTSSDFVAAVTIHSDFRLPKEEMSLLPPFPPLFAMN